jgi:hypothetical protein
MERVIEINKQVMINDVINDVAEFLRINGFFTEDGREDSLFTEKEGYLVLKIGEDGIKDR